MAHVSDRQVPNTILYVTYPTELAPQQQIKTMSSADISGSLVPRLPPGPVWVWLHQRCLILASNSLEIGGMLYNGSSASVMQL